MFTLTEARAHGWNLELVRDPRGWVDYYWRGPGRRVRHGPYVSAVEALRELERKLAHGAQPGALPEGRQPWKQG